jgi:shikimate kinase
VSTRLAETFENTIIALIGFAGMGKYTIGPELGQRTGAKLIDNHHLINNPIFQVVNTDEVTPRLREFGTE